MCTPLPACLPALGQEDIDTQLGHCFANFPDPPSETPCQIADWVLSLRFKNPQAVLGKCPISRVNPLPQFHPFVDYIGFIYQDPLEDHPGDLQALDILALQCLELNHQPRDYFHCYARWGTLDRVKNQFLHELRYPHKIYPHPIIPFVTKSSTTFEALHKYCMNAFFPPADGNQMVRRRWTHVTDSSSPPSYGSICHPVGFQFMTPEPFLTIHQLKQLVNLGLDPLKIKPMVDKQHQGVMWLVGLKIPEEMIFEYSHHILEKCFELVPHDVYSDPTTSPSFKEPRILIESIIHTYPQTALWCCDKILELVSSPNRPKTQRDYTLFGGPLWRDAYCLLPPEQKKLAATNVMMADFSSFFGGEWRRSLVLDLFVKLDLPTKEAQEAWLVRRKSQHKREIRETCIRIVPGALSGSPNQFKPDNTTKSERTFAGVEIVMTVLTDPDLRKAYLQETVERYKNKTHRLHEDHLEEVCTLVPPDQIPFIVLRSLKKFYHQLQRCEGIQLPESTQEAIKAAMEKLYLSQKRFQWRVLDNVFPRLNTRLKTKLADFIFRKENLSQKKIEDWDVAHVAKHVPTHYHRFMMDLVWTSPQYYQAVAQNLQNDFFHVWILFQLQLRDEFNVPKDVLKLILVHFKDWALPQDYLNRLIQSISTCGSFHLTRFMSPFFNSPEIPDWIKPRALHLFCDRDKWDKYDNRHLLQQPFSMLLRSWLETRPLGVEVKDASRADKAIWDQMQEEYSECMVITLETIPGTNKKLKLTIQTSSELEVHEVRLFKSFEGSELVETKFGLHPYDPEIQDLIVCLNSKTDQESGVV